MDFRFEMYRQMFLNLRRGKSKGNYIQAKPIFCLTLLKWMETNSENRIPWGDSYFTTIYNDYYQEFSLAPTPIWKPFFYLSSEPFYSLIWADNLTTLSESKISGKFLRENLRYAKLDDELWELLQDSKNREYLKQAIIDQYLKD